MKIETKEIKKFVRDERTLEVLEVIAKLSVILFVGVAAPNAAGHIIKLLGWVPDYKNKYQTEKILSVLEKNKLIKFWTKNDKGVLELTNEGRLYFNRLKAKKIKLPTGKKWDGMWRMVTFDIPEKLKLNRMRFARNLNFIGMYNIEKSIFIYPHECRDQIFKIAELYEVRKYICYMVVKSIEPDSKLKIYFPFAKSSVNY
ncbi:MAG: hypothetical protein WC657_04475 [Candidatus Paceibacterota bacterium]|jgi:hypothetical protein